MDLASRYIDKPGQGRRRALKWFFYVWEIC